MQVLIPSCWFDMPGLGRLRPALYSASLSSLMNPLYIKSMLEVSQWCPMYFIILAIFLYLFKSENQQPCCYKVHRAWWHFVRPFCFLHPATGWKLVEVLPKITDLKMHFLSPSKELFTPEKDLKTVISWSYCWSHSKVGKNRRYQCFLFLLTVQ